MLLPSRALLIALAACLLLAIARAVRPELDGLLQAACLATLAWAAIDWLRARMEPLPAAQRVVATTLAVGEWRHAELRLHWAERVPGRVLVFDHHPAAFAQEGLPATLRPRGLNAQALRYRIRPLARGRHAFGRIALRLESPWGAWLRQAEVSNTEEVCVYPDFAPLARHALRAVDPRQARLGLQQRRRRGQGMEFSQLREYREGDAMRQIDWKATLRVGRMISREYQEERDQRILLLIDCGRRMAARDGGELSHFDHALNATLMLAYVALSHGDRVGLMTLGGPERYLPCNHAAGSVNLVLRETFDLQPTLQASDFEGAAQALLRRERKRSLVVLMTNLRDEDDQNLLAATRLLGRHHLVLVASLREAALDAACGAGLPEDAEAAATLAAAIDYCRRREATLRRLQATGVLCLDVRPQELAVEAINRYLAVKAASRL